MFKVLLLRIQNIYLLHFSNKIFKLLNWLRRFEYFGISWWLNLNFVVNRWWLEFYLNILCLYRQWYIPFCWLQLSLRHLFSRFGRCKKRSTVFFNHTTSMCVQRSLCDAFLHLITNTIAILIINRRVFLSRFKDVVVVLLRWNSRYQNYTTFSSYSRRSAQHWHPSWLCRLKINSLHHACIKRLNS